MKMLMPCPECGKHEFEPFDDASGMLCQFCGRFITDESIREYAKLHPEYRDIQPLSGYRELLDAMQKKNF